MTIETPWIIDSFKLEKLINDNHVVIVDISSKDSYHTQHIPGAVFIDYASIVKHEPPVFGMLPDEMQFSQALSNVGIKPNDYLVIYDEEGGGKASRLMWTLEIAGHKKMSLLNGGIINWVAEGKAVSHETFNLPTSDYPVQYDNMDGVANAEYILENLNNNNVTILDTRSMNEFVGTDVRASRAGHIPSAINIDWLLFKDASSQRLIESTALNKLLTNNGIEKNKEIIVHCHSHHRSALVYVVLKYLGFEKIKAYPASWSDWASRPNTPIEN